MNNSLTIASSEQDRFDRSRRIAWLDMDSVSRSAVLIVGAGALGNEVAKNVALSGFRDITVVDMDVVTKSNLNRCVFFREEDARKRLNKSEAVVRGILELYSDSNAKSIVGKVEELADTEFKRCNVVFGCLDNVSSRVHVNARSYSLGKPYIDGGMEGFSGRVMLSIPPDRACLQCGMNRSHAKIANLRFSCTGRDVVFHEPRLPAEITTTSVISAIMVREALKLVSGHRELLLSNLFYYDGARNIGEELEVSIDPKCRVHN